MAGRYGERERDLTGVLFDVDGTLLSGSVTHLNQLGETLSRHLRRRIRIDVHGERPLLEGADISGWIDVQVVRAALRGDSRDVVDEAEVTAIMAAYEREYVVSPSSPIRVIDGVPASLERLSAAGLPLALVTGNASFVARAKLASVGLDGYFAFDRDLGFGDWRADRVAVASAAVAALARQAGGVDGLVYVGDTIRDMQAARSSGVRAIGVLSGVGTERELLDAGAESVIGSIADLG